MFYFFQKYKVFMEEINLRVGPSWTPLYGAEQYAF
jgi:hypothetical protein